MSLKQLLQTTEMNASLLFGVLGITPDSVLLLHFDEHLDTLNGSGLSLNTRITIRSAISVLHIST